VKFFAEIKDHRVNLDRRHVAGASPQGRRHIVTGSRPYHKDVVDAPSDLIGGIVQCPHLVKLVRSLSVVLSHEAGVQIPQDLVPSLVD